MKKIGIRSICLMGIILLPVLIVSFCNHPVSDDFAYSTSTYHTLLSGGNLFDILLAAGKTSLNFMQSWQGLYSSAFLLALQPAIFGEDFYCLTTIILLFSLFFSIYFLFNSFNKNILQGDNKNNLIVSFLIFYFLVETVPNPYEAFFWFNGAMNYIFFWCILCIIASFYCDLFFEKKLNYIKFVILILLSFGLSGGNHITAVAGLLLSFVIVVCCFIKKRKRYFVIPFLIELFGFLWNITSPGTRIRAAAVNMDTGIFDTLWTTFQKSFGFFSDYLSISLVLLAGLIFVILYDDIKRLKIHYTKKIFLIPLFSYLFIAGMMCVPYYALGGYGGGRVNDTFYFTFVLLFLSNLFLLIKYFLDNKFLNFKPSNLRLKKGIFGVIVILFIGFFGNNFYYNSTSFEATKELISGEARSFDEQNDDRVKLYVNSDNDEIILSPFTAKPYLLYGGDVCQITETEKCDKNVINKYYRKKVIGIKTSDS